MNANLTVLIVVSTLLHTFAAPAAPQAPATPAAAPGLEGRLVYARLDRGRWRIWEADLAARTARPLDEGACDARFPSLRRDGAVSWHSVTQSAFLAAGDAIEPLLGDVAPVRDLAWSPDGEALVFTRVRTDLVDAMNLWIADAGAGGAGARTLTAEPGVQCHPAWSPDGRRVAYSSGQGWGSYEIRTIARDGSDRRQLTKDRAHDFHPAWSPDGRRIAWSSDRAGDYEIWIMDEDGSSPRRLTEAPGLDTRPTWSPDGRHLAFASSRGGRLGIWVMGASGEAPARLDFLGDDACDPWWGAAPREASSATLTASDAPSGGAGSEPAMRAASAPAPLVAQVGVFPKTIDAAAGEAATIRFELAAPAAVALDLVDPYGVVARSVSLGRLPAGRADHAWDGRADDGELVPPGVYRYVLHLEDDDGRKHLHDPSASTGGEEVMARDFQVDRAGGRLSFFLPKASCARLRLGLRDFPYLGALFEWTPLEAGRHEVPWNGRDASGLVNLAAHPDLSATLWAFALPDNAIIVKAPGAGRRLAGPALHPPLARERSGSFFHASHPPERCGPIRHTVEVLGAGERDPEGRPIVRGKVPIRLRLDPRDQARALAARYEIAVYLDLHFLFEEEDGVDPFTFEWDATNVPPGEHLLTIDVLTYDDHFGVTTLAVVVAPPGDPDRAGAR